MLTTITNSIYIRLGIIHMYITLHTCLSDCADENTRKESERYHTTAIEQKQCCGGRERERERERGRESRGREGLREGGRERGRERERKGKRGREREMWGELYTNQCMQYYDVL